MSEAWPPKAHFRTGATWDNRDLAERPHTHHCGECGELIGDDDGVPLARHGDKWLCPDCWALAKGLG